MMQRTMEQLYDGEIFPNEQLKVWIAGNKEAKDIAFEAHEIFEGKLCQAMKDELDEFLSKNSEVPVLNRRRFLLTALNWAHG